MLELRQFIRNPFASRVCFWRDPVEVFAITDAEGQRGPAYLVMQNMDVLIAHFSALRPGSYLPAEVETEIIEYLDEIEDGGMAIVRFILENTGSGWPVSAGRTVNDKKENPRR